LTSALKGVLLHCEGYPKVSGLSHNEINHNNNKHTLRSKKERIMAAKPTKLTHKIATQLHQVARSWYHLQFSLQAASPETFGYTLILIDPLVCGTKFAIRTSRILFEVLFKPSLLR
jgi:hypothetical protein